MSFQVARAVISVKTGKNSGFDLTLDPEHVQTICFTDFPCSEFGEEVERVMVHHSLLLNPDCIEFLLSEIGGLPEECPDLADRLEELGAAVDQVMRSPAFVSIAPNESIAGDCGKKLCYYDRALRKVICVT